MPENNRWREMVGRRFCIYPCSGCPVLKTKPGRVPLAAHALPEFLQCSDADYASNTLKRTFPRGLDVEVFSFNALKRAWEEDKNQAWREHVTRYIQHHPDIFSVHNVTSDADYSHMRWTVDTNEDLAFVRRIYDYFQTDTFHWTEVLGLLSAHPDWLEINRHIRQKSIK